MRKGSTRVGRLSVTCIGRNSRRSFTCSVGLDFCFASIRKSNGQDARWPHRVRARLALDACAISLAELALHRVGSSGRLIPMYGEGGD